MKKFHPLADLFPLMEGADFEKLVANIKAHGLRESVVVFEDMILDGRNRARACKAAGVEPTYTTYSGDNPAAYVESANLHRLHLTADQKRELIIKLIKADPTKSNRQIAKMVDASHPHIAKVREQAEKTGDVETVTTSVDTKGRQQPAKKKTAKKTAKPKLQGKRELEAQQAHINELETARERDKDLAERLQAAETKIIGLESEIEELKAENADLRAKLDEATKHGTSAKKDKPDAQLTMPGIPGFLRGMA